MTKNRVPRKLKKGCRTLDGNPRTKWQRKGLVHIAKMLQDVLDSACAVALSTNLVDKLVERIIPETSFPSGGISVPPPPKVGVAQMPTSELVMNHDQIERLKNCITHSKL